ncbi:MAG: CvpA family protein [Thermodesulfobacteriota bacterium]
MILDIVFACYCLFGAFRGRRRKLSETIYRLLRILIAVFAGVSLFRLIGGTISKITGNVFSESLGFLTAFILPLVVLRLFRRGLSRWIESSIGQINESKWGMLAGFIHSLVVSSALLISLALSQSSYLSKS